MAEPYGYEGPSYAVYSSQKSPRVILDLVLKMFPIHSALDVGCGIGNWSSYLQSKGVDAIGIDGDWVPRENVKLKDGTFLVMNIAEKIDLKRKFDLVVCLEVAEHLTESSIDELMSNLTRHGDIVLFSAAIPGQGGFEHINEKWQSHWVKRFEARGYVAFDVIRPSIWGNRDVEFYYQQNVFVAIQQERVPVSWQRTDVIWDVVHPELYNRTRNPKNISLKKVVLNLRSILTNHLRR